METLREFVETVGLINQDAGMINDTNDTKYTANGRKKRSIERGRDNEPRSFPLHTMKNIPQFRNKSHEEVRQYILEKKGVDIGNNFNLVSFMLWVFVILVIVAGGIAIAKWLQKRQERKNNETHVEADSINYE